MNEFVDYARLRRLASSFEPGIWPFGWVAAVEINKPDHNAAQQEADKGRLSYPSEHQAEVLSQRMG